MFMNSDVPLYMKKYVGILLEQSYNVTFITDTILYNISWICTNTTDFIKDAAVIQNVVIECQLNM